MSIGLIGLCVSEEESVLERLWALWPGWEKTGHRLRFTMAGIVFFLAVVSIFFTLFPVTKAYNRDRRIWTALEELLWPYLTVRHLGDTPI